MKPLQHLLLTLVLLAPAAQAAVVFMDNFSTGSTLNSATPAPPSAGSAAYHLFSSKAWSPTPTLGANDLRFGLAAQTNDFIEVQARFARAPLALMASNDFIELTVVFTNTSGLFTQLGHVGFGLYNSGGVSPLAGGLNGSATNGSPAATGGAQRWRGYVARIAYNGGTNRLATRPAQSINSQDLLTEGSNSQSYTNGVNLATNASTFTRAAGSLLTEVFRLTRTNTSTLKLESKLYLGGDTNGTLLVSQTATATGANFLNSSFDSLAVGWRTTTNTSATLMDIKSIAVNYVGPSYPLPVITLIGGAVVTNECHAAFTDPGATVTGVPLAIASGESHNLALKNDGTVAAWGNDGNGQTTLPVGLSNVVAIAGGASHSLALKNDGTVAAWGAGTTVGELPESGQSIVPVGLSNVVAIAGGGWHSLVLKSDGRVVAWGDNSAGQTNVPGALSNVVALAGGSGHSLALKSDGKVAAWGDNFYGQTNVPVGLSNVVALAAGNHHTLALKSDGKITAWGLNGHGQTNVPVGLSNVVAVAAGHYHSLALKNDGKVVVWGRNDYGQTNVPVGLSNVVGIAGGLYHSLALKSDGTGAAWGFNNVGQTIFPGGLSIALPVTASGSVDTNTPGNYQITYTATNSFGGVGTAIRTVVVQDTLPPVITVLGANPLPHTLNVPFIDPGATALDVCAGSVAVTTNSTVNIAFPGTYAVRYIATDSSGNATTNTRWVRVVMPPVITLNGSAVITNECHAAFTDPGATATGTPLAVAAGGFHNLALKSDGTVAAWGANIYGQTNIPVGLSNVAAIAGGGYHSLALKSDGTVAAWGRNLGGQTNIPAGLSNVVAIAGGWGHSLALKSDGTVAAWGDYYNGSTFVPMFIPVGLSNVVAIAGGDFHGLALKSDRTVAAWGANFYGETNVPAGLSNVVSIAGGSSHSLALRSDGTVVAWGNNFDGQTNIPVGLINVVAIAGGGYHSLALKSDGKVVVWGRNDNGQTNIPVGLSNVVAIAGGGFHSLALKSDGKVAAWGYNGEGQTNIPVGLSISLPVTVSGSVDTNTPGNYLLAYAATNSLGGSATTTRTVVVRDTLPPVITVLGANPLPHTLNVPFIDPGATALDACAGGVAVTTNSTVNIAMPGTYAVTYTATDSYSNSATRYRLVQVVVPPVITLNGSTVVTNECHFTFTDPGATATDAPLALAGGYLHSLALKSDGKVAAWGYNGYGQTNVPAGLSNVVAIAGGHHHSLALKSDGTVAAWGRNLEGQTNIPVGLSNVVTIAGGNYHNLALKSDGTLTAWGWNGFGQTDIPVGLSNVVAIAGGDVHSLALKSDGKVAAWGYNGYGETNIPVGLSNVVAIAGGGYHNLALKSDGKVVAWGLNNYGQTNIPVGLSNVVAIAGGYRHSLALKSDGNVVAWGGNTYGETNIPVGLSNVVAIAGGERHSLALKSDGTVVAWGDNSYGQTTIPEDLNVSLLVAVSGSVDTNTPGSYLLTYTATNSLSGIATATRTVVVQDTLPPVITVLGTNPLTLMLSAPFLDPGATALDVCGGSFAVTTSSTVNIAAPGTYAVSYIATDGYGNVATNIRTVMVVAPPPVITLNGGAIVTNECHTAFTDPGATATDAPLALAGGYLHSLALKSDGKVAAWGWNQDGQTNVPVGLSNVVAIAAGDSHNLALKSDGTVTAWGYNGQGQTNIPVGLSNVVTIAGGNYHSLAIKSDGKVAAWGNNSYGQTTIPVGLSNVVGIAGGYGHSLVLKSDGKVAAWGYNDDGQTNIPVGLSNVVAIAGGERHSLALKSDGTVAAWGYNYYGQTNIPVGLSNVVAIAGGVWHSLALKSDGTVAAWGYNGQGQTTIPVGLSNVVAVAGGGFHNLALKSDGTGVAWGYNSSGQTNIPVGLSISLPVTVSGSVDTNTPGSYLLTYTATNSLGGIATTTRTVVVQDRLPPVINMLGANPLTNMLNVPFVDPGATALDVCAGGVAVTTNSTVNIAVPGTYAVTYTATDISGNAATNSRVVRVVVAQLVITCPPNVFVQCVAAVPPADFSGGSVTDNLDPNPVVTHVGDVSSGSCPQLITRTYRATDASGNTNDCAQLITVHDTTAPVISQGPTNRTLVAGVNCLATVPDLTPGLLATDNCAGALNLTQSPAAGSLVGRGLTLVTVTVTDGCGNSASRTNTLTIVGDEPPLSQVLPLPAQAGPVLLVQWQGAAAPCGVAPVAYDVFVSTNGTDYTLWRAATTATSASYPGTRGQSYYFYSVARDGAGHVEAPPLTADAQTLVPTDAPELAAVTNATLNPGETLIVTNTVVTGTPVGEYLFSVEPGSPTGVSIVETNGVLRWTPTCAQATSTNVITVRVRDSGQTNLTDTVSFTVVVGECVSPQLGRVVLAAGTSGRVPVNLISTVPLTNLTMRLILPAGQLINPGIDVIVPQICGSGLQPLGGSYYQLTFATCPGQSLIGTQQVAWLNFTAAPGLSSTVLPLELDNITGRQPDGTAVANFAPQSGRVVVVGTEPYLELLRGTGGNLSLVLYSAVNSTNRIQRADSLTAPGAWNLWQQVVMPDLFLELPLSPTNPAQFFRVVSP